MHYNYKEKDFLKRRFYLLSESTVSGWSSILFASVEESWFRERPGTEAIDWAKQPYQSYRLPEF